MIIKGASPAVILGVVFFWLGKTEGFITDTSWWMFLFVLFACQICFTIIKTLLLTSAFNVLGDEDLTDTR